MLPLAVSNARRCSEFREYPLDSIKHLRDRRFVSRNLPGQLSERDVTRHLEVARRESFVEKGTLSRGKVRDRAERAAIERHKTRVGGGLVKDLHDMAHP